MEQQVAQVATSCGGDNENYYYFYCGSRSYANNTPENIARFGQEHIPCLKDLSLGEIRFKHIYWATEGAGYKSFYNGDTYVLFGDVQKLPDGMKADALRYCKGLQPPRQELPNREVSPHLRELLERVKQNHQCGSEYEP